MKSFFYTFSLDRGLQSTGRRSMSRRKRRILNLIGLLRWVGCGGSAVLISRERDGYFAGAWLVRRGSLGRRGGVGVAERRTGDCADHFAGICTEWLGVAERRTEDCADHFAGICTEWLGVAERRTGDCADHFAGALADAKGYPSAFQTRLRMQTAGRRSMSRRKRRILNFIL